MCCVFATRDIDLFTRDFRVIQITERKSPNTDLRMRRLLSGCDLKKLVGSILGLM